MFEEEDIDPTKHIQDLADQLYDKIVAGDELAWNQLYEKLYPYAVNRARNALYYLNSADEVHEYAEEVANSALVTLWDQIQKGNWDKGSNLRTWLETIIKNKAYNVNEKRQTHKEFKHQAIVEPDDDSSERFKHHQIASPEGDSPDNDLALKDDKRYFNEVIIPAITKMIDELPEEEAIALKLRAFENMSYKEIANKLGWPTHKVTTKLENARWYTKRWLADNADIRKAFMTTIDAQSDNAAYVESTEDEFDVFVKFLTKFKKFFPTKRS